MPQKITPFLWFDGNAEEAANFYVSVFPNSEITEVSHYGEAVIREFGAPWVKVSVAKPGAIPAAREVGVVIERTPDDYA